MSDRRAEKGFAPIALTAAMGGRGGFRPLSFVSAPPESEPAEAEPAPAEIEAAEDPFALGLAEGPRLAEAAYAPATHRLVALPRSEERRGGKERVRQGRFSG